jgi:hypothetical protein
MFPRAHLVRRTNQKALEQKDGTDPDIQRDRTACSAVAQNGSVCAKRCKEPDGVERSGNMFSLTSKDISGL